MTKSSQDGSKAKVSLEEVQNTSDRGTAEDLGKEMADYDELPPTGTQERIIAEKKLVRKLDSRVLPTIFVIYIMNYIDVSAISPGTREWRSYRPNIAEWYYNSTIKRNAAGLGN